MLAIWRVWKSSKHCSGVNDMAEQHEKALVPQIRFTGFTDPWEQRKLGELVVRSIPPKMMTADALMPMLLSIIQGEYGTVHRDCSLIGIVQFDRNSLFQTTKLLIREILLYTKSSFEFEAVRTRSKATCCEFWLSSQRYMQYLPWQKRSILISIHLYFRSAAFYRMRIIDSRMFMGFDRWAKH